MKTDVRAFRLGKWYIPKESLSINCDNKGYHALGYFDIIEVEEADKSENIHPWRRAYDGSYRIDAELQSDYFVQEIKAFTNISDDRDKGFEEEDILAFWEEDSLLLAMSMLHVSLETNISELIQRINQLFCGETYLYYYSFDYSGIIVVAKGMSIHDYLDKILTIKCHKSGEHPIVKDTYSMYGLQRGIYANMLEEIKSSKACLKELSDPKKYEIAVNISVSSYSEYMKFEKEFFELEEESSCKSKKYTLPGRHDISIVNEEADFYWLFRVQALLDRYSTESKNAFYSYETFVKMCNHTAICEGDEPRAIDEIYHIIGEKLKMAYQEFQDAIGKERTSYQTPVREVCNSVLSILRNAFAEDFILCMYQAFWGFLQYLLTKKKQEAESIKYEIGLEKCFIDFFDGLSSLINSAMHTDRQFIQPTSFNAIFYDVPPKIMAFYVAMIHRICETMSKGDKYKYVFLMKPSFSDEITNKVISFPSKSAEDRIWQISINERFLYHPEAVMRRIAHEIAHVKGDGLRLREIRKGNILRTYVYTIFRECAPLELPDNDVFSNVPEKIYEYLKRLPQLECNEQNYSYEVKELRRTVLKAMIKKKEVHKIIRQYIADTIEQMQQKGKLSEMRQVVERELADNGLPVLNTDTMEQCSSIQKEYLTGILFEATIKNMRELYERDVTGKTDFQGGILGGLPLGKYAHTLINLYSETYADIQMIQILNMPYNKYLEGFIMDENLDVDNFENNNEDISRIAVVSDLLWEKGVWNKTIDDSVDMKKVHEKISQFLEQTANSKSPYFTQNKYLKSYLKDCFDKSKAYYATQEEKIEGIRRDIGIVIKHEDVQKVYGTINQVLGDYKKYLKDMTWDDFQ